MDKHIAIQLRELPVHDRLRANFEIQKILMDFRLRNIIQPLSTISSGITNSSTSSILNISSNPCTPQTCTSEQSTDNDVFNTDIIQATMSSSFKTDHIPVSYTHLDVYKRQTVKAQWIIQVKLGTLILF